MAHVCSDVAAAYLRVHLCEDIGPIRFANLLRELGGIERVLSATLQALMGVERVGDTVARQIVRDRGPEKAKREIELAAAKGVQIICLADPEYPVALKNINDPPACLYVRGALKREDAVALGIVGSRHCSRYGAEQAERLAALATRAGLTIVSGMARGIDTYAHRGALAAQGRTIAVLGCGLCHLYPAESVELAERIANNGALLSELPMEAAPDSKNFPPRNRIIAGMSLGVLVVEAAKRSGALITARLASEYNREVFAVPGRADGPYAEGCHELIRSGGAKLVTGLPDILDELGEVGALLARTNSEPPHESEHVPVTGLDDVEREVLNLLGPEPLPAEAVCSMSSLPPARIAAALTGLQLKGAVRRVGANLYERICRA